MREIRYNDGAVRFKIPEHWEEEYDEEGTGIYYKDAEDSGTLRVTMVAADAEEDESTQTAAEFVKSLDIYKGLKQATTSNKDVIIQHIERVTEEDTPLTFYFFDRVHRSKDDYFQIVHISWTIETRFEDEQHYKNDLKLVENLVQDLRFKR